MIEFDNTPDRRNTSASKWDRYADRDVLPFWVADMEFRAPEAVITALHERIDHGVFGYTRVPDGLTEVTLEFLQQRYDWKVDPSWLVWLPGVVPGLNLACRAVGAPGDAVASFSPVYYPFFSVADNGGRRRIDIDLVETAEGWRMDLDAAAAALTPDTHLLLLCNPQNPTGRVYDADELRGVAELAERHDLILCSDEIHAELILDERARHIPIATLDEAVAQRTITLMAPTKTFNIPGLSCAFAVIPDRALRRRFREAQGGLVPGIGPLALTAAEAAYRHGEPWRQELLAYLRGNRDHLAAALGQLPGLRAHPVQATCLTWIDARELGVEDPHAFFEDFGVGFSPGAQFGAPGFVRCNFGCSRAMLQTGIQRVHEAVASLG